jgi:hypothetical protein
MLCSITVTQAQKNKKRANPAAATDDKGWKPTKGDTRNPFDTTKTKQVKANGLGVGEDPFEKKIKGNNKMTAANTGELQPDNKANARSRKGTAVTKKGAAALSPYSQDSLKAGSATENGLIPIDDPFGKSGAKRKKPAVKKNGYANQEVSYAKPDGAAVQTQNGGGAKPVKGKKQVKPVTPANQ